MTDNPERGAGEGGLDAPFRHPIAWREEAYYDLDAVEAELTRVFEICHGCRRCFNLCDAFPTLFDLIDNGRTGEIDGVDPADYAKVDEACTLCDMCFMTKCPYVPPHEWNVDFPHLILRRRAAQRRKNGGHFVREQLGETDRNGKLAKHAAGLANWASDLSNKPVRSVMEATLGIDRDAFLPRYHARTASDLLKDVPAPDPAGPAFGKRKAALFLTCFSEYNAPAVATAAAAVLARQGVDMRLAYPVCCGMPQLEAGDLAEVADRARQASKALLPLIEDGFDIVTLTASCGLMMKFEWPLILPENDEVRRLSAATRDISQYVVELAKAHGLADGLSAPAGGVTLHHACHQRAQNMGAVSRDMLRLIPGAKVDMVERCSGHGGTFGVMKGTHEIAVKVGRPAARQGARAGNETLCSDCPLACRHLGQLVKAELGADKAPRLAHPIEIMAQAYGLA
ncbi:MAG TPA: heterodisulfide reductase-related iron-sulfur binding cluster [Caulobacteraceae bacterium]|nr:heterodisulfide reductase-related iron-sulfur binding cluster [Caulobacteraceae bacterium]